MKGWGIYYRPGWQLDGLISLKGKEERKWQGQEDRKVNRPRVDVAD